MNYAVWKFWLDVILILVNAGIGIYVWWSNREKVTNTRFRKLEERLGKVEGRVERMPVCENHARMEANDTKLMARLDDLHGDIRELAGSLKGLSRAVDLMNEHLINKGK